MLVLARSRDQSIMIGDDIKITVVEVRGNKVRLGIDAPQGVSVHREEIYRQIKEAARGTEASASTPSSENASATPDSVATKDAASHQDFPT